MISDIPYPGDAPGAARTVPRDGGLIVTAAGFILLALLGIALFGRIMSYPLQHDEQIHIAAGAMVADYTLYRDLGYNHLPNMAWTLAALFKLTGEQNYLLVGRLLAFGWWLLACTAIALTARRVTGSRLAMLFAVVMLVSNTLFLGQPGLLVTNSFAPIALALLGVHFFVAGLDAPQPHASRIALAGICVALAIGFRVSYIFLIPPFAVAALVAPAGLPLATRLRSVLLPFALAGIVGMLPTLVYLLSDLQSLLAHTVRYFTGPHLSYWQVLDVPKAISIADKVQLAEEIWFSGATLLSAVAAGAMLALSGFAGREGRWSVPRLTWPIWMVLGLIGCGILVSFAPTPAFAQYYAPPVAFLTLLALFALGRLEEWQRRGALPLLAVIALLSLASGASRLGQGAAAFAAPAKWAGVEAHATGARIAALVAEPHAERRIATLSPVLALEAGFAVYPEFASGPFQYRVADLVPADDRRYYRIVSPRELPAFLSRDPPVAIVTGHEGALDAPFEAFAREKGYRAFELPADEPLRLFVQPAPVNPAPAG